MHIYYLYKIIYIYKVRLYQWSENRTSLTENTILYFPIGFNTILTVINVGFVIGGAGRQLVEFTPTFLSTSSDMNIAATNSYLAIGI